jgi:hypothetical protein
MSINKPVLNIAKAFNDHYKFALTTDDGKITCDVSVERRGGPPDIRSDEKKREEALGKAKKLGKALFDAITGDSK